MNITAINPNYQAHKPQMKNNSQVDFRGRIGTKMLEKAGGLELKSVLAGVTGFFGLKAGKVKDVLESFIERINLQEKASKVMKQDIASKGNRITELESQNKSLEEQAEIYRASITGRDNKITELQQTIINKDKEIAELAAYRKMQGVKPISELAILMPDELIKTIKDAKAREAECVQSAFEFAMTGKGQEALVEQINRSNLIQRAINDGMKDIPAVSVALDGVRFGLGYDQEFLARSYFLEALQRNKEGSYLVSNSIRSQVEANIEAFLAPLRNPKYSYKPIIEITNQTLKYHKDLEINKEKMIRCHNMKFEKVMVEETESLPVIYYVYTDRNLNKIRISERNLANGNFGYIEKCPKQ